MDDISSAQVVRRLARPAPGGAVVIERAAVFAEGAHFADIEAWILRNGGEPEAIDGDDDDDGEGGMYAARRRSLARTSAPAPSRYFLPASAVREPPASAVQEPPAPALQDPAAP
jgi:hypothetical protein